jgi:hypothetical protein
MRGALATSFDFAERDGDGVGRVFTWRRGNAIEATVKEGANFVCLLTLLK